MPSEPSLGRALSAVAGPREAFRAAVATAAAEIGARLNAVRTSGDGRATRAGLELGTFAVGRIDAELFATTFAADAPLDAWAVARLDLARQAMVSLLAAGDAPFTARLDPGDDLRARALDALGRAGRAFAAARSAEMVRLRYPAAIESDLEDRLHPALWNRFERQIAPPLILELDGGDLLAGGLAELMAGAQKIVMLARGPAPPAPLVRLITPGVLVLQTAEISDLDAIGSATGPAIAALLPEGCARFLHRPGSEPLRERLQVDSLPPRPRGSLGKITLFQQLEELEQLRLLAELAAEPAPRPQAPVALTSTSVETDPADRLAAWLLRQAGLNGHADAQV